MNFKDEYSKAAEEMNPDRETMDRIKANVLAKISKPKKAMPLKQIACAGGAIAACAVVTIAAVSVLPKLSSRDALTTQDTAAVNLTAGEYVSESAFAEEQSYDIPDNAAADEVSAANGDGSANGAYYSKGDIEAMDGADISDMADSDGDDSAAGSSLNLTDPKFPKESTDSTEEAENNYTEAADIEAAAEETNDSVSAPVITADNFFEELFGEDFEDPVINISEDLQACTIYGKNSELQFTVVEGGQYDGIGAGYECKLVNTADGLEYRLEYDGNVTLYITGSDSGQFVGKYTAVYFP